MAFVNTFFGLFVQFIPGNMELTTVHQKSL